MCLRNPKALFPCLQPRLVIQMSTNARNEKEANLQLQHVYEIKIHVSPKSQNEKEVKLQMKQVHEDKNTCDTDVPE